MTIEEFKKLNREERIEYGKTIPEIRTYDEDGNELSCKHNDGYWYENTYDNNGNKLTYKNNDGFCSESTYDKDGNELTHRDNSGYWVENTYDKYGNILTRKNSKGDWFEWTYDDKGNHLTHRDSDKNLDRDFEIKDEYVSKKEFDKFVKETKWQLKNLEKQLKKN